MADEKKPKIDLKARLGKTQVGAQAPAGIPAPVPSPSSGRAPAMPPPTPTPGTALPVPPGVGVGAPPPFGGGGASSASIDPSNPLAAVATPYRAPTPPPPPQAQRIEVDEVAVHEARKGARRMGFILALVVGAIGVAVGYVAGGATEKQGARAKSKDDAHELAQKVDDAKSKIKTLNDKIEAGRSQLLKDKKFPAELAKDLGGINVDFDGSQLAGRRFSGFPTTTTQQLVDFVTSVQSLNDRKLFLQNTLSKLQKPITEQLAGQAVSINLMVVATKDGSAILAPLKDPIKADGQVNLPKEFVFLDPGGGANGKIDKYNGGDLGKGAGFAVTPSSFNKVCPSETQGQIAQLGAALAGILRDIQGEKQPAGDIVQDTKPGLMDRADTLSQALKRVE